MSGQQADAESSGAQVSMPGTDPSETDTSGAEMPVRGNPDDGRHKHPRKKPRSWWWIWIGVLVGALAVSGALIAVLYKNDGADQGVNGAAAAGRTEASSPELDLQPEWRHEFPEPYTGPVWITVEVPDDIPRTVTIIWGPWQRRIVHEGTEPLTYLFGKGSPGSVPVAVEVEPAAQVAFDHGTPPDDAIDVNADWDYVPG